MNSNRSLKSNTSLNSRLSNNRASSPINPRLSALQEEENELPRKTFNDADRKFHKLVFERCANQPERKLITNREKFNQLLSYVGYDLLKSTVDNLWSDFDGEINFQQFQKILNQEKPITERALEEAFETLYGKDKKFNWNAVDYNRFRTDMLEKGDRLSENEFNKLRSLLGTDDGKVDVKKLTKTIEENKTDSRDKLLSEKQEQIKDEFERPLSRNSSPQLRKTTDSTVDLIIEPNSKKLFIPPKTRSFQRKGAFFCEYFDSPLDAIYWSIGYSFELKRNTSIWITIETKISPYHKNTLFKNLDMRLFLFETMSHSTEKRLLHISSEQIGTKCFLHLDDLPKGSYEIIPVTFGGVLRPRSREINERVPTKKLRETKRGNQFAMTHDYRAVLEYIFDVFDFDENKQLDRQEYNLWTVRTTGEEITDDDWTSIQQNVHLDVDENISREKFIQLNDFEVQDKDTTEGDLWNGLKSLGFNYALELDMMCPFVLNVHTNDVEILRLKPTSYVEFTEIKKILLKFLKNKGDRIKINNSHVDCYHYHDACGSIVYAENKDSSVVRLKVQLTGSKNASLNLPDDGHKPVTVNIRQNTSEILWFAHRLDSERPMELSANIEGVTRGALQKEDLWK